MKQNIYQFVPFIFGKAMLTWSFFVLKHLELVFPPSGPNDYSLTKHVFLLVNAGVFSPE